MPNTRRGREPLFPYDHELERTLHNMNRKLGINDEDPNQNVLARDPRGTTVLFLSVYLAYKEDNSEKESKTIKQSKIQKISTKL